MTDSHCHPNCKELRSEAAALMERAKAAGVNKMLIVGCDAEDSAEAVRMANDFAHYGTYAAVGIHPHEVKRYSGGLPDELKAIAANGRVAAVGETGLDYHYDLSPRDAQINFFELQLAWATELNLPVVLHIRDAMDDALSVLKDFTNLKLLFHCYGGGMRHLDTVLGMGGFCAIGGAVTWKNAGELREVAANIPVDRLLLETDCPYMTPAPFRGKVNEPSYVKYVYEAVAAIRGLNVPELTAKIDANAAAFFGWGDGDV